MNKLMTYIQKRPIFSIVLVAAVLLLVTSTYQFASARTMKTQVENSYNHAFFEFVDAMEQLEISLEKALLVRNEKQILTIANEITRYTQIANGQLGLLPSTDEPIDAAGKFIAQVGGFAQSLTTKTISKQKISEDDYKMIKSLVSYSRKINETLRKMRDSIYSGNISFGETKKTIKNAQQENVNTYMADMQKQLSDYPALVYDGPFSSHIEDMKSVFLANKPEISMEDAKKKVKEFIGSDVLVETMGETASSTPGYNFVAYPDPKNKQTSIIFEITKQGGYVKYMIDNTPANAKNISIEQAKEIAKKYLIEKGFGTTKDSYFTIENNVATINMAYLQGNVIMYPDLIKVKINMDSGKVVGLETSGYLFSHKETRDVATQISEEQARNLINQQLKVKKVSLCVIPTETKSELLCYEIKGEIEGKNFLIYVNAKTGVEEKIMILVENENGILSM